MALIEAAMLAAASRADFSCPPLVDISQVWSRVDQRWLIIGEDHGTNEQPEIFLGVVCQASAKRKVTVAVEQPASEQSAIDAFVQSDGGSAARARFLSGPIWRGSFKDGRSSQAYMRLFDQLRLLRKAGRITSVRAFQPAGAPEPGIFETKMAEELLRQSPADSLVVVLVGSVHAMRTPVSFGGPAYLPMAGHLPRSQTMSVALRGAGGKQWACQSPTDCGSFDVFQEGRRPAPGLTLNPGKDAPYSAVYGLSGPTSASPPQILGN